MIGIFTIAYNQPQYLPYQVKLLRKYLVEPHEFCVVDNTHGSDVSPNLHSANLNHKQGIKNFAVELGISYCENTFGDHRTANYSHSSALQYTWNYLIKNSNYNICAIIDHDMFLVEPFSITEYLSNFDIAGVPQSREHVQYLHPAIMLFRIGTMPNKDSVTLGCGVADGLNIDVGGLLYHYLTDNPSVRVKRMHCADVCDTNQNLDILPEYIRKEYQFHYPSWIVEGAWWHGRLLSNWVNLPSGEFDTRTKTCIAFLEHQLNKAV